MGRIRVLHVGLDTHLGGIETYLLKIASNIDRNRFQFDFLAYDNEKPCFHDELESLGCGFRYVRSRRRSWFGNARDIRDLLAKERYDIIHCHLNSLTYITPALEGLKAGTKVIIHSRNAGWARGSSSWLLGFLNRYRIPWNKVTRAAVSDVAGQWMFGKNRDFIVLNNGVDTSLFRYSEAARQATRETLGIKSGTEVIVNTGAFRAQKNHSFLLDVFDSYHREHENSILLLVGGGELESEIRDKAGRLGLTGSVVFAGVSKDVAGILSASDKFLFPSLYEGFPNALLEAEASGLPCVVSDTITSQACLDNCVRLSPDAPVGEWVHALETVSAAGRAACAGKVDEAGFGLKEEISRLENLYSSLSGGV